MLPLLYILPHKHWHCGRRKGGSICPF